MKHSPALLLSLGLLLLLAATAQAEQIERTFPAPPGTALEIRNLNGQLTLHAWDQPQVRILATRSSLAVETHFEQTAHRIHVHTHVLQTGAPVSDRMVEYEIWAPPDIRLQLYLETGTLQVENFTNDVSIETVAADVHLRNLSGYTTIQTLNGSLVAERCSGRLEATSISGRLYFSQAASPHTMANTTSGDIIFEGDLLPGGSYEFISHEGRIDLRLPASASFELNARSVEGEVTVADDFPFKSRGHGRPPRPRTGNSLLGTVHTGEAMVRATSFSGTIRVRKQ
ncbi:MAG: DUF4097 domain-containing protein [Terriglobia bacterium]